MNVVENVFIVFELEKTHISLPRTAKECALPFDHESECAVEGFIVDSEMYEMVLLDDEDLNRKSCLRILFCK